MCIEFYGTKQKPYGCFSNFSRHPFLLDGQCWPTVEHYFQAMKFENPEDRIAVREAKTPMLAKFLGNDRRRVLRPGWERVKEDVMRRALRAKFEQNEQIRAVLLETGSEVLIENAPRDTYWGIGTDRTGQNRLGVLLMELRESLR